MEKISTPIKIVVGVVAALIAALLVMYFVARNNDSTTSAAPLQVEKPLDFTNDATGVPGPVFYIEDSQLDSYLEILLEENDQVDTSAYTKSYTQTTLSEGQVYMRRHHPDTQDPSAVIDLYAKISLCLDDDCDLNKTKLENDEYSIVFTLVFDGFWHTGILTTHTHKDGVLLTSILSKGKVATVLAEGTVVPPVTTVAP